MRFRSKVFNANTGRNAMILILVFLAVYQTTQLWFENLSNRNFFYSFFTEALSPAAEQPESGRIPPYRIITGFGNKNHFHIGYGGMTARGKHINSLQKNDGDSAILTLLREGEYIGISTADTSNDELVKNRAYIYDYGFAMPADAFARSYGQKGNLLTSKFESFTSLAIIPPRSADEKIRFLFMDSISGQSYAYACPVKPETEAMGKNIQSLLSEGTALFYLSSEQSEFLMFDQNTYIPQWPGDAYAYHAAAVDNPYVDGEKLLANIGRKVDVFFNNPTVRQPGVSIDGVFTYRDDNTVVKYHAANDVLEYASYNSAERKPGPDFLSSYYSAVDFIEQDRNVTNEYHLAGYQVSDMLITFYFDYTLDNLPVILPDSLQKEIGMEHHLEVSVENQRVNRYKKLVYNYYLDENMPEMAHLDFYGSLNSLYASSIVGDAKLANAMLGYKVDKNNKLLLYWFLDIEGTSYVKSAY